MKLLELPAVTATDVLSAKWIIMPLLICDKSFIKNRKIRGSKTDTCATPILQRYYAMKYITS